MNCGTIFSLRPLFKPPFKFNPIFLAFSRSLSLTLQGSLGTINELQQSFSTRYFIFVCQNTCKKDYEKKPKKQKKKKKKNKEMKKYSKQNVFPKEN